MPEKFEGLGLTFLYPETWKLEQENSAQAVMLESPSGAFMTITDCGNDLELAYEQSQKLMATEFEEVEKESVERVFAEQHCSGLIQRFVYLDLIVVSTLLRVEANEKRLLVQI